MAEDEPTKARRRSTAAARATTPNATPADDPPAISANPNDRVIVETDQLHVERGSIGQATTKELQVHQGAVGRVDAETVLVKQGALGGARAGWVSVELGALGGAVAREVSVRQGYVGGVLARDVSLEMAGARTVVANRVTMGPQSGALVILAARVEGGRSLVDWRGGVAFGLAFALASAFLRRRIRGG